MKYDLLIVGTGLYGSVIAWRAKQKGLRCLVLEKRPNLGGNIYDEKQKGILIHRYGPHIFHTNDDEVWSFICQFAEFNHFRYMPMAHYKKALFNLPFNMNTFYQLFKLCTPTEVRHQITKEISEYSTSTPRNLEEQAISLVGNSIYQILIKGYTQKQWGRDPKELPSFIIKRLPVRYTFDNNYFNDSHQGIPKEGYTSIIKKMLEDIEVHTNVDFLKKKTEYLKMAKAIVYTGSIDAYFDYQLGYLQYRSLRFEDTWYEEENHQGCAVINETAVEIPYTRSIEHKHFLFGQQSHTLVTREYPIEWKPGLEAYYPINDELNSNLLKNYKKLAENEQRTHFGGRLGDYQYYDMDTVIRKALNVDIEKLLL